MPPTDELQQIEERLTVLLAQSGNREALSRLIDIYDRRLLYFIRRVLGDSDGALDVLQSVWLMVYRKLGTLRSADAFRVWLYRIAHDQAVNELRRRSQRPVSVESIDPPLATDEGTGEETFDNAELVHAALQSLSIDHRRVLTLRFLEDMSVEEIAAVVGGPVGTVKSRLHYAKKSLRARIEELLND